MSSRAKQPRPLRKLIKRATTCLLLGAVLQYLVAAGFGLVGGSFGVIDSSWVLEVTQGGEIFRVDLKQLQAPSFGSDVLAINLASFKLTGGLATNPRPDWSQGEWIDGRVFESEPLPAGTQPSNTPPSWSRYSTIRTNPDFDYYPYRVPQGWLVEVACGWPARSTSYLAIGGSSYSFREGILLQKNSSYTKMPRVIPLRIYWPGTIVNTLLYAAVLFIPFTLVPFARRNLRRRAGRCLTCGYDLRGTQHDICPECGACL